MTACTEPRLADAVRGLDSEGQKGMPVQLSMTACTEPRLADAVRGLDSEGQKGMPEGDAA